MGIVLPNLEKKKDWVKITCLNAHSYIVVKVVGAKIFTQGFWLLLWVEFCLPKRLCSSLTTTPRTSECDLIKKQNGCRCNWLRWGHPGMGWAPNSIWRNFTKKDKHKHRKNGIRWCIYKPRKIKDCQPTTRSQVWGLAEILSHSPQKEPILSTF